MKRMTSPERVRRVLSGKIPDRVPVLMQNFLNIAHLASVSMREFCHNGRLMAEVQLDAWERFGYDVLDLENGTFALAEALGCQVEYPEDRPPYLVAPALENLDAIGRLAPLDPHRDGTLPELVQATRLVAEGLRGRACIVGEADQGPFSLASMLLGMEALLLAVVTPDLSHKVHQLLTFCYEQVRRLARAQIDAGADFTQIGDSIAGPDVCSPSVYRRFAFPYEKRLVDELATGGIQLIIHMCGDSTRIISDMAETGAAMLEVDYKIDTIKCREATRGRSVLVGNVDPSSVMALGSPEDVMEASRIAIQDLGQGGWFILSPGCTLPATTPPENVEAMVEAAKVYGRYNLDGTLIH